MLQLKSFELLTPVEWAEGRAAGEGSFFERLEKESSHPLGSAARRVLTANRRERGFLQRLLACEESLLGELPEELWALAAFLCADIGLSGGYSSYLFGVLDALIPPSPTRQWEKEALAA